MLSDFWSFLQLSLYPAIEECLQAELTGREQRLLAVLEFVMVEQHVNKTVYSGIGRPMLDRRRLMRAFIAKAYYGLPTTKALRETLLADPGLRLICGYPDAWRVPSLATFSRAFRSFANDRIADRCHADLVRHHVGDALVLHETRDSTIVPAREKPVKKDPNAKRRWNHFPTETQYEQSAEEALANLPRTCGVGRKPNSHGNLETWIGYKSHVDWLDGMIPANVETTSASVHDSQLAIPMMRITAQRVPNIAYQLMDSAYDAPAIRKACRDLDQVDLIEGQKRRKNFVPFAPHQAKRFCERTNSERGFSRLKDEFGLNNVRVRGWAKVHFHVMLGILVLFADQMMRPIIN